MRCDEMRIDEMGRNNDDIICEETMLGDVIDMHASDVGHNLLRGTSVTT